MERTRRSNSFGDFGEEMWRTDANKESHTPLNRIHSTVASKSRFGVRKSPTKHDHRIIHTARVPMQNFLCYKRPFVDFVGDGGRERTTSLVGKVDMSRVASPAGSARTFGVRWGSDAFVNKQNGRRDT